MRRKCCLCALLVALFLLTLGGCGEEAPIAPTPTPTPVPIFFDNFGMEFNFI